MTLGVRAPGRHWKHRWALSVLNSSQRAGLSSRLFQQIREERGLAYTVYSSVDNVRSHRHAVGVHGMLAGAVR